MKKIIISAIAGIFLAFAIGWTIIGVWLNYHTVSGSVNLFGLKIMEVTFNNGEAVKNVNNVSMALLGIIMTAIVYTTLTIIEKRKSVNNT